MDESDELPQGRQSIMAVVHRFPVRILHDTVEKSVSSEPARIADKYRNIRCIGEKSGFLVPRVLEVRPEDGVVVFERIRPLRSVRDWYLAAMEDPDALGLARKVFYRIGRSLAAIHDGSYSHSGEAWVPSDVFCHAVRKYGGSLDSDADNMVELHADFGFANVFTCDETISEDAPLVIIDPCADGYSTFNDWCRGSRYVDIGKMLLSLEGKVSARHQLRLRQEVIIDLQSSFLQGYGEHIGKILDVGLGYAYAYGIGACYFYRRFGPIGRFGNYMLYNRLWKRNYPLGAKIQWMNRRLGAGI